MMKLPSICGDLSDVQKMQHKLPMFRARERFLHEIKKVDCAIIIGETASGKTTQIPQFILQENLLRSGMLACTQPRRVAAITVAQRVAMERDCKLGEEVGYCVRFEDCTSTQTKLKYMTDGMLLREAISDKLLLKYSFIILDEAHERTVHTDVLFGIVKNAQQQRKCAQLPELKLVIMSATMDVDHFSKYFGNAPVLYVEGRLHPIKLQYLAEAHSDYFNAALTTLFQLHQEEAAQDDILVFLTGQEEIESMAQTVRKITTTLPSTLPKILVCPLFASLPHHHQLKAFRPTPVGCRKVVLSTNIAETSITIKGIKFVIDTGKVKSKSFLPHTGLDVLSVNWISKAQAWQRAGRAGREQSGIVYRLYTEAEFEKLPDFATPEIQRTCVSSVVLHLLAIGVDNILTFDFIDSPNDASFLSAITELKLLDALTVHENALCELTPLGKRMSVFPLEPKLSKVIVISDEHQCTEEIISLIAMLSVENILYTPMSKQEEALKVRKKFFSSEGDFALLLNIYRAFKQNKGCKSWCFENFVNHRNMCVVMDIRKQLKDLCSKAKIASTSHRDHAAVRKCAAAGLFMNAAELHPDGSYRTIDSNQTVYIHPSSCLFHSKPAYVVFKELIQTSKCYMRDICVVDIDWLLTCAPEYFRKKLKICR